MISPENKIGQNKNGSPAQICIDGDNLADLIFGSNSECLVWCANYLDFNSETVDSESAEGFKFPVSAHAHAHAHAHTH